MLEEIIRQANPKEIVVSALGVREGLLFSRLSPEEQAEDPLIVSAREFNELRSRAPDHGEELFRLDRPLDRFDPSRGGPARIAACVMRHVFCRIFPGALTPTIAARRPMIWWRTAPSSEWIIPRALFLRSPRPIGICPNEDFGSPQSRALVTARQLDRARILGAAMRVAYNISAAMPGVSPRAPMVCEKGRVILTLPADLAPLAGERLESRMRQFARLIGESRRSGRPFDACNRPTLWLAHLEPHPASPGLAGGRS